MWHSEWLQHNLPSLPLGLQKELAGLGHSNEQSYRMAALRHGLFRINYAYQHGRLTVEGESKFLSPKVKEAVRLFVKANLPKLDWFSINLFAKGRVHAGQDVKLFALPAKDRLKKLPFITEASDAFLELFTPTGTR